MARLHLGNIMNSLQQRLIQNKHIQYINININNNNKCEESHFWTEQVFLEADIFISETKI